MIETGYSPTIHSCEFMNYQRKFSYCEHLFFHHSAAQLQLGKTWTELLVISEIKIDIVYDFILWLWAWDHHLRLSILLHWITLNYLITGFSLRKYLKRIEEKAKSFLINENIFLMGCLPKAHSFCSTTLHLLTSQHITGNMCGSKQLKTWHTVYFPGRSDFWKFVVCNGVAVQVLTCALSCRFSTEQRNNT